MQYFRLREHKGAGMKPIFYVDGVRVSREKYEHVERMGYMYGTVDTFHTSAKPVKGGKTRRTNSKLVRY